MAGRRHDKTERPSRSTRDLPVWFWTVIIAGLAGLYFFPLLSGGAHLWEDFIYSSYPLRSFAATSMAAGEIPFWNPYTFNGMPFAADILTTVFYLPCALLILFVHNGALSSYWLQLIVLLHFVLAGVSMFFLARSFRMHHVPALFAGVAYMFTGFMVLHAIHQQVVTLAAWIPLILLLFRRALTDRTWTMVFVAGLVLGHSTLCGFPQLSLYIYSFLFAFWLFELLSAYPGRALLSRPAMFMALRAASVVGLSLTVAAIQLLPTIELSSLSQRASITYEFATEGSLAWSQLLTLVFPKLFGSAGAQGYNYWGPGTYWYYWETVMYIGILPILLMAMSVLLFRKERYVAFFWGFALFALLFALGNNFVLHRFFYEYIPGFSRFRNPARIGILFAFPSVLLAGFMAEHILYGERTARETRRLRNTLAVAAGTCALLWLLLQAGILDGMLPAPGKQQISPGQAIRLLAPAGILLASAAVIAAMIVRGARAQWVGVALIAVLTGDLYLFGGAQNNGTTDPDEYFASADRIVKFIKNEETKELSRVNTRNPQGMIMDRNQGMISRIFQMEGYTPFALQRLFIPTDTDRLFDLMNVKYKTVTDESRRSLSLALHPTYMPRASVLYATHTVASEEELVAYLQNPQFNHRTTAILEENAGMVLAPDSTTTFRPARVVRYSSNAINIEVQTARPGFLLLSETYYPGWNAYIDGQQTHVYRADYNLRGIFVPAGDHAVDFRFESAPFRSGTIITLLSLVVCGAGIAVPMLRGRKESAE